MSSGFEKVLGSEPARLPAGSEFRVRGSEFRVQLASAGWRIRTEVQGLPTGGRFRVQPVPDD